MAKVVTAPLVIAKLENGSDVYLYQGSPLPEGLASDEEKRLADYLEDDGSSSKSSSKK